MLSFRNLKVSYRDPLVSLLEGVLGKGDRKLGKVIHSAWKNGAKLDAWSEFFNYAFWRNAFEENGIDPEGYLRQRDLDEILPWDHIDKGSGKDLLKRERERAFVREKLTEDKGSEEEKTSAYLSQPDKKGEELYGRKKKRLWQYQPRRLPGAR